MRSYIPLLLVFFTDNYSTEVSYKLLYFQYNISTMFSLIASLSD